METFSVVLTTLNDLSNETFLAVLLHGTILFSILYNISFGIFLEFRFFALLEVKG